MCFPDSPPTTMATARLTSRSTAPTAGAPGSAASDRPQVPAAYEGEGTVDIGVNRPPAGVWFIINSAASAGRAQQWGALGDPPFPADYDGDGKTDIAVYRPS